MKLEKVIKYLDGTAPFLAPTLNERDVNRFVIDSREIESGDVFFALSQPEYRTSGFNGDFVDSTKFVVSSFEKGAAVCVVREDRYNEYLDELEEYQDRLIFVQDVIASLQILAHRVYLDWNKPVVAITGSAGKTTAKELTANVLEAGGFHVLRSIKNYNNGLGLPLTVLQLVQDPSFDVAVLEMGMSSPGKEIARLCRITPPDVAVELNVLPVHVEHLGSMKNIAMAKAELVEGMKRSGTAVLNADDTRVAAMSELSKGAIMTYGVDNAADVMARDISVSGFGNTSLELVTPGGVARVGFRLNGKHNILNALAAAAVGYLFKIDTTVIGAALSKTNAPPQRGEIIRFAGGFTVINDTYNSNPDALRSMVKTLVDGAAPNERTIVVAGEMLELGEMAKEMHRSCGHSIAGLGVDVVIGVRGLAIELVEGAKQGGAKEVQFAETSDEAGEILSKIVRSGDVILIKGSRGVRTENVISRMIDKHAIVAPELVAV